MAIAIATFVIAYLLLIDGYYRRTAVVLVASVFLLLTGIVTPLVAFRSIAWDVLGVFFGMLVLSDLFVESRMPAVIAAWISRKTASVAGAIFGLAACASVLSLVLENVAVVLIFAPVALALAKRLGTSAAPLLIGIAIAANLQAAALMVGDPPAMYLGTYAGLSFNDFLWHDGRPGIFFAVQLATMAALAMFWLLIRKHRAAVPSFPVEVPSTVMPTVLLVGVMVALPLVVLLASGTPHVTTYTVLTFAAVGWLWHLARHHLRAANGNEGGLVHTLFFHRMPRASEVGVARPLSQLQRRFLSIRDRFGGGHRLLRELDWETMLFLIGVFILVQGLVTTGAIDALAGWLAHVAGTSTLRTYVLLIVFAVVVSAFVDNIPFIVAMLPVASHLALGLGIDPFLLYGGLLLGTSVGGNITPIGASANIVAFRWLQRYADEPISFGGFVKFGLPMTLAAMIAAGVFGWFAWQ
ncbi:MAG: SLC13 family permease [bacterium]|nr:SLC13 family permease [bacterium]